MSQRNTGIAKVQHYVPQFLLKNFGNGKKDQLQVFDKKSNRTFPTNAKNIASESRFYDFNIDGEGVTLEPMLSVLEGKTKPVLQRILDENSIATISPEERILLSSFFAIQYTRTRWFRENWCSLPELLGQKLREMHSEEELEAVKDYIEVPDENRAKAEIAQIMVTAPEKFGPYYENKSWVLLSTTKKHPFIIGDHPLAMQNQIDMEPYGNIGLDVKGIEIYFPLSPTRAMGLWCPSIKEDIEKAARTLHRLKAENPHIVDLLIKNPEGIEALDLSLKEGTPLPYNEQNVRNFNSLQVSHAERYVFSSADEFALAREMLADNTSFIRGRRMKVN